MKKIKHVTWREGRAYFQIAVPQDLQGRDAIGVKTIEKALGYGLTDDVDDIQNAAIDLWKAAKARFKKARARVILADPHVLPPALAKALQAQSLHPDDPTRTEAVIDAFKTAFKAGKATTMAKAILQMVQDAETNPDDDTEHTYLVETPAENEFIGVLGGKTPILGPHFERWLAGFSSKTDRTQEARRQSVTQFVDWLRANKFSEFVESVTINRAAAYAVHMVKEKGYRRNTAKKLAGGLGLYWKALAQFEVYTGTNPWPGILQHNDVAHLLEARKDAGDDTGEREAFEDAELEILFTGNDTETPHRSWVDAMACVYLSGLRTGELYSLQVKDCQNGFFHVRSGDLLQADGVTIKKKSRKNKRAVRLVPIHSELVPIVERLIAGKKPDDRLFIEGATDRGQRLGKSHSDKINEYRQRVLPANRVLTYYSLRHNAESAMRSAGVDMDTIQLISGQTPPGIGAKVYANFQRIFKLKNPSKVELEKLEFMRPALEAIAIPPKVLDAIRKD